jgi:hypothetical protein
MAHALTLSPHTVDSSPFSDGSVCVAPDWVAPTMTLFGAFSDVILVDVDAQAGGGGDGDEAFRIVENRPIGQVVKQVIAHVLVDTEALLLDDGVVRAAVNLQAGGKRNGAEGTMQRHRDVVRLRHCGDLAGFGNAPGM